MTFWMIALGVLTIISSLGVVLAKKPLNSALCLVVTLFLVAAHFALLGAHFVAAIQILVYAGAIMVLVIFVIMLLGVDTNEGAKTLTTPGQIGLLVVVSVFIAIVAASIDFSGVVPGAEQLSAEFGTTESVGEALYTRFVFSFEVIAVLLLAALIGAVMLAFEPRRPLAPGRGLRAKQEGE